MPINYLSQSDRADVLKEILGNEENLRRKEKSLMQFEIYKGRQAPFVLSKLAKDIGKDAALNGRSITSINMVKKIIEEQAAVYRNTPERTWSGLNKQQEEHIQNIYRLGMLDTKLKKTNRIFKLNEQAALQIVPKEGKIEFRPLFDHHYDVLPKVNDPEKADAYIVSSFDKSRLMSRLFQASNSMSNQLRYYSDFSNQKIAENDDYRSKINLFYWWTEDYNFITNTKGEVVDELGNLIGQNEADMINPIGQLPFIDVARDKDFEFFVRSGAAVTDFNLDLSVMLSDVAEINRLQGFSQAVISSTEEPKDLKVGPRRVLFLKIKPNATDSERPQFQFVSPSPDLASSLKLLSDFTSLFLSSQGLGTKVITTGGEGESFKSGLDRFLAMVEKFDASQDDVDLFKDVESKAYQLTKSWNNLLYNVTEGGFIDELSGVFLSEDSKQNTEFQGPQMVLSQTEELDVIQRKLEMGLISEVEAIMMDRNVDEKTAKKIKAEMEKQIEAVDPKTQVDEMTDEQVDIEINEVLGGQA